MGRGNSVTFDRLLLFGQRSIRALQWSCGNGPFQNGKNPRETTKAPAITTKSSRIRRRKKEGENQDDDLWSKQLVLQQSSQTMVSRWRRRLISRCSSWAPRPAPLPLPSVHASSRRLEVEARSYNNKAVVVSTDWLGMWRVMAMWR